MKIGNFNINDYIEKLYENAETGPVNKEGLIIPEENKRAYNWLKKEYHAGQTEVKVEMKFQGAKFEPGYHLQTDLKSVKDFKPGMYGEIKTKDTEKGKSLDNKKQIPNFSKNEGDKTKDNKSNNDKKEEKNYQSFKTKPSNDNIKNKKETNFNIKKVDLKAKKNDK